MPRNDSAGRLPRADSSGRLSRSASSGRLSAQGGNDESQAARTPQRPTPRVQTAPARLQGLDTMVAADQGDLNDAAYFAPPTPCPARNDGLGMNPNGMTLASPDTAAGAHGGASLDRGGLTLTQAGHMGPHDISMAGTRNLGGLALGGTLETPATDPACHAKIGITAGKNGQSIALAPNFAVKDAHKDEMGLGIAVFGSANSRVDLAGAARAESAAQNIGIVSRHAASVGFALDPRLFGISMWAGAFCKMLQSHADETLFRLTVTRKRAGQLLDRQQRDGFLGGVKDWARQWSQVLRNEPSVRHPDIADPFGEAGGRKMRPGQTLTRYRNYTRMLGAGIGAMGLRAGHYELEHEEMQLTVRCIDAHRLALVVSPRNSKAKSNNIDSPLGPNVQSVQTNAQGSLTERIFDWRDPAQRAAYLQLVGTEPAAETLPLAPEPGVVEKASLTGREDSKGVVRLPFKTSMAGKGEQSFTHELEVSRDEQGHLSQSREVGRELTQHQGMKGRNAWRVTASSQASSVALPALPCMLAFRGLHVTTERSATRPDLEIRNNMIDEHARLWRKDLPPAEDGPRNDYKIAATVVYSGRQLAALQNTMPSVAAQVAQQLGAAVEPLIALIGAMRNADQAHPLASAFARAWRRSLMVADYLQTEGAPGAAALHRLLGGGLDVRTESTAYIAPLQELRELQYVTGPSAKSVRKLKEQLEGALRAARADVILRAYDGRQFSELVAELEEGLRLTERLATR